MTITMKYMAITICTFLFSLCARGQTITLSDFAEDVINAYISQNIEVSSSDAIIVHCSIKHRHYYMHIFSDCAEYYDIEEMSDVVPCDAEVRVSGSAIPFLFTGNVKTRQLKLKQGHDTQEVNYDPTVWQIAFHKDGTICKMLTYKGDVCDDIQDIVQLSENKLYGSEIKKFDLSHIYNNHEADNPAKFLLGEETLHEIMKSAINIDNNQINNRIPIIINLIISKDGKVHIDGFLKKSDDKQMNITAMKVARIVAGYDFTPASHRGEVICVSFPLYFFRSFFTSDR